MYDFCEIMCSPKHTKWAKSLFAYNTLDQEPMTGFMPEDVLTWLSANQSEPDLALAYSIVRSRLSSLMHLCDEIRDPWVNEAYDNWHEIECYLIQRIVSILEKENLQAGIKHILSGIGTNNIIRPFMERNGYVGGLGWWVKL